MKYSYTHLYTFNKCRWLWWLTYVKGIRPVKVSDRLNLGSLVHVGLAAVLKGEDLATATATMGAWVKAHYAGTITIDGFTLPDTSGGLLADAVKIVSRTVKDLDLGFTWETAFFKGQPIVEMEFEVPLADGDTFGIRVDWVARHIPTGTVWVFDHKTRTAMQSVDEMDWSLQLAIYQYILVANGVDVTGSVTHQIRAAVPGVPKLNKDKTMSRADLFSDWETYSAALVAAGLNPADYADMQTKLAGKVFTTIARTYRSRELLDRIWFETVLQTIAETKHAASLYGPNRHAPRNLHTVTCKLCSCAQFCQTDLIGGDTMYLIENGSYGRYEEPTPDELTDETPVTQ